MVNNSNVGNINDSSFLNENIDLSRFIQPHGVLFVVQKSDFKILQLSKNTHYFFKKNHQELLGKKLDLIFDKSQLSFLSNLLQQQEELENINPLKFSTIVNKKEWNFDGIVHYIDSQENFLILELEPSFFKSRLDFLNSYNLKLYNLIRLASRNINKQKKFQSLCEALVNEIQKITGFDRVMLYKFDKEGHGKVISESIINIKKYILPSYLGLHFPSSDIPPISKELFLTNLIRLIPDLNNEPVEIYPYINPITNKPIPLNSSVLRGVSPCHIEYLKNMEVSASLCISLIKEDSLWGMIVCHHQTPKYVPYQIRKACEFLGEVMASQPVEKEKKENKQYKIFLKNVQSQLIEFAVNSPNFAEGLMNNNPNLLDICKATGAVFLHNDKYYSIGITPEESQIKEIINILKKESNFKVFHTDCLVKIYPDGEEIKDFASGLMAISIAPNQHILWFRPEVIQTVEWAGNPEEAFSFEEDKLSPRKSFETWKQNVVLKSLPWTNCEIENVTQLRKKLIAIVLRQIYELSSLNEALKKSEAKEREKATQLEKILLELQNTQTQLIQREKMSLLGEMIAGIAHEINNPVGFIKGNLIYANDYISDLLNLIELYQEEYPQPSEIIEEEIEEIELDFLRKDLPKMLDSMKVGIDRITNIINSLRNFSRLDNLEKKNVDIHEGIESTLMILNNRLKASNTHPEIKVIKNYGKIPLVNCYISQMNQVFMNIIVNAIDALEEQYEKTKNQDLMFIEITTNVTNTNEENENDQEQLSIKIKDNGIGISQDIKENIFDNYFTTKPMGKGTGFGLAISHQIVVKNHQGELTYESLPNQGTTFFIKIPLSKGQRARSKGQR